MRLNLIVTLCKKKKNKKQKTELGSESVETNQDDNELNSDSVKTKKRKKQKSERTELDSDDVKATKKEIEVASDKKRKKQNFSRNDLDNDLKESKPFEGKSSPELNTNPKIKTKESLDLTTNHSIATDISNNSKPVVENQWKGNLFENSDRQNKFLRLMGGMKSGQTEQSKPKKGLFGSLASLCKKPESRGQIALSTLAAAELNAKLEEEYSKALNFKLTGKKGSGFGFTPDPAEGKKFHIDINKTKSVKFEDVLAI